MTVQIWRGDTAPIAQVVSLTPAAMIPGDQFNVVINGKTVSYTTVAATVSDVCSGLQTALANSTIAEFLEVGWTNNNSLNVLATAANAGTPFTLTASVTAAVVAVPAFNSPTAASGGTLTNGTTYYYVMTCTNAAGQTTQSAQVSFVATTPNLTAVLTWTAVPGATGYKIYRSTTSGTYGATTLLTTIGSGATVTYSDTGSATGAGTPPGSNTATSPATLSTATVTSSAGPNDASVAANWSSGSLPTTGDTILITGTSVSILYGLNTFSAVTVALLQIDGSFTGTIGLPDRNSSGYYEYRQTFFRVNATTVTIGANGGSGSGRIRLNLGTVATAISVYATASPLDTGLTALQIQGSNSSNTLYAYQGSIGLAIQTGLTAQFATVSVSFVNNKSSDVSLFGGAGLTLGTLNQFGGSVTLQAGFTTAQCNAGTLYVLGTGAATTITIDGGSLEWYSSGTITTLNVGPTGSADFSLDSRSKTVTTTVLYSGAKLTDPNKVVTWTNGIQLSQCRFDDVTLDLGENRTFALTA